MAAASTSASARGSPRSRGSGKVAQVRLADGATLPADLVLLAVGARPNDDLAAAAGLPCQDGVVVDEHGRTADPAIYAAGDCTRFPSRRYGRALRLECVQNAIDQAKAVASEMLGKPQHYDPVPWFWSDQYELKLQMAGLSDGYDDARTVGDVAAARFSVEYRKGGRLIAVDAVNDGRAYMSGRKRIAEETAKPTMRRPSFNTETTMTIMYHDGNRRLQDQFDSRRISDRLEEKLTRTAFTADDKAFIESAIYFFLSTADAEGGRIARSRAGRRDSCASPATTRSRSPTTTATACSRASATCWSIPTSACCSSTCTSGRAACASTAARRVSRDDPLLGETVGAQLIVRVKARAIFPNCPRYIPKMQLAEPSVYVPQPGVDPVEPAWKGFDLFKGYVHPRQPTAR